MQDWLPGLTGRSALPLRAFGVIKNHADKAVGNGIPAILLLRKPRQRQFFDKEVGVGSPGPSFGDI